VPAINGSTLPINPRVGHPQIMVQQDKARAKTLARYGQVRPKAEELGRRLAKPYQRGARAVHRGGSIELPHGGRHVEVRSRRGFVVGVELPSLRVTVRPRSWKLDRSERPRASHR